MTVIDVVLPTLAVVLSWLCVGAVLAGCGYLARRLALRLLSGSSAGGLSRADLWIGLATLVAYLQVWNLFFSVSWVSWVAPVALGLAGLTLGVRRLRRVRVGSRSIGVVALTCLGILWLANRALAVAGDYDLGLYHFGAIGYALKYPTLPGLGNVEERLSAGDAHLLFVAFLQHGPWARAGFHLADGLLVAMLFVDLSSRFVLRPALRWPASFTGRMALLLVPATIVVVGIRPTHRLSSPNLDLAAFVLVAVGALYLAECVEQDFQPTAIVTATASLALASVTRPLYWLPTLFAVGLIGFAVARERSRTRRALPALTLACTLPGALLIGWMGRQAILSGYPLFPLTIAGLHVDWRVPASVVHDQNRWDHAWARLPGIEPQIVLGSWHWLSVWWLAKRARDPDVVAPLLLLACLVPSLWGRSPMRSAQSARHRCSPFSSRPWPRSSSGSSSLLIPASPSLRSGSCRSRSLPGRFRPHPAGRPGACSSGPWLR